MLTTASKLGHYRLIIPLQIFVYSCISHGIPENEIISVVSWFLSESIYMYLRMWLTFILFFETRFSWKPLQHLFRQFPLCYLRRHIYQVTRYDKTLYIFDVYRFGIFKNVLTILKIVGGLHSKCSLVCFLVGYNRGSVMKFRCTHLWNEFLICCIY